MPLDQQIKDIIKQSAGSLVTGVAAMAVAGVAMGIVSKLVVTNVKEQKLTGDVEMMPTDDKVSASNVDAAAVETEGKLAQDKVSAVEGNVKAAETAGTAVVGEATAADSGATALRTKAGASDIEVKALKMT